MYSLSLSLAGTHPIILAHSPGCSLWSVLCWLYCSSPSSWSCWDLWMEMLTG